MVTMIAFHQSQALRWFAAESAKEIIHGNKLGIEKRVWALVKQGVPVGPQNWSRLGFDNSSIRYFGPKTHSQHSGLVISCDFQDVHVQSNGGMVSSIDRQNIWLALGWVETTSSFYPLDSLVCCVCPKVGYTPENKGCPRNSSEDFGHVFLDLMYFGMYFWHPLSSDSVYIIIYMYICIYIYICQYIYHSWHTEFMWLEDREPRSIQ